MRFSSNLIGDSKNLREGLATVDSVANPFPRTWDSVANPFPRTGDLVANPSPRIGDTVANHSRRFYNSPRNIYTLISVSRRTANQKSTKIGEPHAHLPILIRDSKNLGECLAWNASKPKKIILKQKSIQPKKQAQKSHATVPLSMMCYWRSTNRTANNPNSEKLNGKLRDQR